MKKKLFYTGLFTLLFSFPISVNATENANTIETADILGYLEDLENLENLEDSEIVEMSEILESLGISDVSELPDNDIGGSNVIMLDEIQANGNTATIQKGSGLVTFLASVDPTAETNHLYIECYNMITCTTYGFHMYNTSNYSTSVQLPAGDYVISSGGVWGDTISEYPIEFKSFEVVANTNNIVNFDVGSNGSNMYIEETIEVSLNPETEAETETETKDETSEDEKQINESSSFINSFISIFINIVSTVVLFGGAWFLIRRKFKKGKK